MWAGAEGSEEGYTFAPSRWLKLVDEYLDIFEPPGMPADGNIVHKIELKPGSEPLYQWKYCIPVTELAEVRCQLDEYFEKGWTWPNCSPYGIPIVFI